MKSPGLTLSTSEVHCTTPLISPSVSKIPSFINIAESWGYFPERKLELLATELIAYQESLAESNEELEKFRISEIDGLSNTSTDGSSSDSSDEDEQLMTTDFFEDFSRQYEVLASASLASASLAYRATTFFSRFLNYANC
jgi:hypothetical protein